MFASLMLRDASQAQDRNAFGLRAQRALIESCICIDYLREAQEAIYYLDEMRDKGWLRCSVVTYAELLAGCRNRREERAVRHKTEYATRNTQPTAL